MMNAIDRYKATLPLVLGILSLTLLVGGIGAWSVRTEIAGAVLARGTMVVETNRQVVQHADGGTVARIAKRDGDVVTAGEVLVELDGTVLRSELSIVALQLSEIRTRRARLEAERDEMDEIIFPDDLRGHQDASVRDQMLGQRSLFEARRDTHAETLEQLASRMVQFENRIAGAQAQRQTLMSRAELVEDELKDQEDLFRKGIAANTRILALRRETTEVQGQIAVLEADGAALLAELAGLKVERSRLQLERREAAISMLRDIQFRELELNEQKNILEDRIERLTVRAPVSGTVYGTIVFAQGAVVQPAEPLMYVIPSGQSLVVDARIEAVHVDQVHVGQSATLRFTAFDQSQTPEVDGIVQYVSADAVYDEATGRQYYRVTVEPDSAHPSHAMAEKLLPGMPVETMLKTESRTPLSYLVKPIGDYLVRAFREV